jgi:hypothetical protein
LNFRRYSETGGRYEIRPEQRTAALIVIHTVVKQTAIITYPSAFCNIHQSIYEQEADFYLAGPILISQRTDQYDKLEVCLKLAEK